MRLAGLEPARLAALPPQSSVSANSTISARLLTLKQPAATLQVDSEASKIFPLERGAALKTNRIEDLPFQLDRPPGSRTLATLAKVAEALGLLEGGRVSVRKPPVVRAEPPGCHTAALCAGSACLTGLCSFPFARLGCLWTSPAGWRILSRRSCHIYDAVFVFLVMVPISL